MEGNESIETFLQSRKDEEIAKISKEVEKLKFSAKEGISKIQKKVKSLKNKNVDITELCLAIFEIYGKIDVIKKQTTGKCPTDTGKVEKIVKDIIGDYGAVLKTSKLTNYIGHEVNQEEYSVIGPSNRSRSVTRRPSAQSSHSQNTGTTTYHQHNIQHNYHYHVQEPRNQPGVKKKTKARREDTRLQFINKLTKEKLQMLFEGDGREKLAKATVLIQKSNKLKEIFKQNGLFVNDSDLASIVARGYSEDEEDQGWALIVQQQFDISKQKNILCEAFNCFIKVADVLLTWPQMLISKIVELLIKLFKDHIKKSLVVLGGAVLSYVNSLEIGTKIAFFPMLRKNLQSCLIQIFQLVGRIIRVPFARKEGKEALKGIRTFLTYIGELFGIDLNAQATNISTEYINLPEDCPIFFHHAEGMTITISFLWQMAVSPIFKQFLIFLCGDLQKKTDAKYDTILCEFLKEINKTESKTFKEICGQRTPAGVTDKGWAFWR